MSSIFPEGDFSIDGMKPPSGFPGLGNLYVLGLGLSELILSFLELNRVSLGKDDLGISLCVDSTSRLLGSNLGPGDGQIVTPRPTLLKRFYLESITFFIYGDTYSKLLSVLY